jgi:hypothetical protein
MSLAYVNAGNNKTAGYVGGHDGSAATWLSNNTGYSFNGDETAPASISVGLYITY